MERGITTISSAVAAASPDVSRLIGYRTPAERALGIIESIMSASESLGKTWYLRTLEAKERIRRNFSLQTSFRLVLSVALSMGGSTTWNSIDKNNRESSVKIGNAVVERTTDIGSGMFRLALRTLEVPGQADIGDQQFISYLRYSPDQLENEILTIRKRYPTSDGKPMENTDELLDLARLGSNDPVHLSAVSSARKLGWLLDTVSGRTDGRGNIESLARQIRVNKRVADPDTFYSIDPQGKLVRKDSKDGEQAKWLYSLNR